MTAAEAKKEYMREYRRKHADKLREYKKAWNHANPDKVREHQRTYWEKKADEMMNALSDSIETEEGKAV